MASDKWLIPMLLKTKNGMGEMVLPLCANLWLKIQDTNRNGCKSKLNKFAI